MKMYFYVSIAIFILCNCFSNHLCQVNKKHLQSPGGADPLSELERNSMIRPTFEAYDEICPRAYPFFDGVIDNPIALAKACAEFIPVGMIGLGLSQARWPHKILLKAIVATGTGMYLSAWGNVCLNPITQLAYIARGRKVNEEKEGIVALHKEMRVRMTNIINKYRTNADEMQKNMCCVWLNWKLAIIDLLGSDNGKWYVGIVDSYLWLVQIVFCQEYQDNRFDDLCTEVDFEKWDKKPKTPLAKHIITTTLEGFLYFI